MTSELRIREEQQSDIESVHRINEAAFGSSDEADLVDALREGADPCISLVAEVNGDVVGHIMFSPVTIEACDAFVMGLAPMSVKPGSQRQGVGSALVRAGLDRCEEIGAVAVVVLGHSSYYPRFGFSPASGFGLRSGYEAPDEAFMAVEIAAGALADVSGLVRYHPAFAAL